jgi:Leucine-rich repeat (LRR) protein
MTPEEAYEEALRRIRVAKETGALELDLSRLALNRLPQLAGLTSLLSLSFSRCYQLSGNLSPLAGLTSLQSLNLAACNQLNDDLSPLAGLTSLQTLDLSYATNSETFPR